MKKFFNGVVILIPWFLLLSVSTKFVFPYFIFGLVLISLSLWLIFNNKKAIAFLFFGISEVVLFCSFSNMNACIYFLFSYLLTIILFKIWRNNFDVLTDELYNTSFMQNNPEEVAKIMFKQIEKKIGKSYLELSYMDYTYKNDDYNYFKSLENNAKIYPIKIFDKEVGYFKIIPLKKIGFLRSAYIKQTLDITIYWLMNVTFLSSITLLESLENFASRNDYGIIIENNGNFLYTNKYIQKNFSYIHNLEDLINVVSDKYKDNFMAILENEGNDIFVLKNGDMELFVGIGIEKSNRSTGNLNIIKISSITSSNINEILLYKFDTLKFKELVSSLYIISTMENEEAAFKEIISTIKSKILNAKNMFIFIKHGDDFKLESSDVDEKSISIAASEIPDVIGPWFTKTLTLKSEKMLKYLKHSNAIITKFSDGSELEGLLILTLDENANIDKLDISIINIMVQYINIALINIVTVHKLSKVAKYDGLTGLLRREAFEEMFSYVVKISKRTNKTFSLVYIDMDHLKLINDKYGHEYGDSALKLLASTLKSNTRSSDISARLGGDEFVVLLSDTKDPSIFIDRVRKSLNDLTIPGLNIKVSASFGAYVYDGKEDDPNQILSMADSKMYEEKKRKEHK